MVQGEPKTSALVEWERSHSGWSTEFSYPTTATGVGGKYRGLRAKDQRSGDRHARIVVGYANRLLSGKRSGYTDSARARRVYCWRVFRPRRRTRRRAADGPRDGPGRAFCRRQAFPTGPFLRPLRVALRRWKHAPRP